MISASISFMDAEKWSDLVGRIKDAFTVEREFDEPIEGNPGTKRVIIFSAPMGRLKLEYYSQPAVIGTHGIGSRRIGSATTVTREYSATEHHEFLRAYKWENDVWIAVAAENLLGSQKTD